MIHGFAKNLLNFLIPPTCHICKLPIKEYDNPYICRICWKKIRFIDGPVCPRCGIPFKSSVTLIRSPDYLCGTCRKQKFYFTKASALGYYEGTLSEAIHIFKYEKKQSMAKYMNSLTSDSLIGKLNVMLNSFQHPIPCRETLNQVQGDRMHFDNSLIVPVPLHKKRLNERGFNQSLLIAHHLSKSLNIPLSIDGLQRVRWTRPQIELSREERLRNVKGAFAVRDGISFKGKKLLLIDDVYTTGATVNECARMLKKAGAKEINVFTIARVGR
ncbi:MAG: ComF family protein [Nitrospirota bacterium]